jgi:hypothetical protein
MASGVTPQRNDSLIDAILMKHSQLAMTSVGVAHDKLQTGTDDFIAHGL